MANKEKGFMMGGPGDDGGEPPRHLSKQEFGRKTYKLMVGKGWRQSDLARAAGLERNSISNYLRGKAYPSRHSLDALSKALGVKSEDLLPNITEAAIKDEMEPDFSIRSSIADPSRMWLHINREVSSSTAAKIATLLEEDRLSRK